MSLTLGTAPLAQPPAGQLNFRLDAPEHVLYLEDSPRRVRTVLAGETVAQSDSMKLLHESGSTPTYYFPLEDVRQELLQETDRSEPHPGKGVARFWDVRVGHHVARHAAWRYVEPADRAGFLADLVAFRWRLMDAWYEEDEEVFVHPRDPYHRVDALRTSRHVRALLDGEPLADSRDTVALFETGLPTRWYFPAEDVRDELLVPSEKETRCPYKGIAAYHTVQVGGRVEKNLVWYYPTPLPPLDAIAGRLAFFNERVQLEIDGARQERPVTMFS